MKGLSKIKAVVKFSQVTEQNRLDEVEHETGLERTLREKHDAHPPDTEEAPSFGPSFGGHGASYYQTHPLVPQQQYLNTTAPPIPYGYPSQPTLGQPPYNPNDNTHQTPTQNYQQPQNQYQQPQRPSYLPPAHSWPEVQTLNHTNFQQNNTIDPNSNQLPQHPQQAHSRPTHGDSSKTSYPPSNMASSSSSSDLWVDAQWQAEPSPIPGRMNRWDTFSHNPHHNNNTNFVAPAPRNAYTFPAQWEASLGNQNENDTGASTPRQNPCAVNSQRWCFTHRRHFNAEYGCQA